MIDPSAYDVHFNNGLAFTLTRDRADARYTRYT